MKKIICLLFIFFTVIFITLLYVHYEQTIKCYKKTEILMCDFSTNIIYNVENNNIYELDIFIGDVRYHNKGIGYKSILIMSEYLFEEKNANWLVMCPLIDNYSAIKCYQKCGFINKNKFTTEDTIGTLKEYILMLKENK